MAPPPGQTNKDTRAADHTVCFYCHQQLLLAGCKVIVSRDAHGCAIRICEPCVKEKKTVKKVDEATLMMKRMMGNDDED